MALPLVKRGFHVDGIDLSEPMLQRLREKFSGSPISLAVADATASRSARDRGGAYLRHVLHLIPDWRTRSPSSSASSVPVVGSSSASPTTRVCTKRCRSASVSRLGLARAVGLQPDDPGSLMAAMSTLGARGHRLPPIRGSRALTLNQFLEHIEQGHYTWTWPATEAERRGASRRVRAWLARRFGDLDRSVEPEYTVEWWAFDLSHKPIVGLTSSSPKDGVLTDQLGNQVPPS